MLDNLETAEPGFMINCVTIPDFLLEKLAIGEVKNVDISDYITLGSYNGNLVRQYERVVENTDINEITEKIRQVERALAIDPEDEGLADGHMKILKKQLQKEIKRIGGYTKKIRRLFEWLWKLPSATIDSRNYAFIQFLGLDTE